jgi:hypothetical protein
MAQAPPCRPAAGDSRPPPPSPVALSLALVARGWRHVDWRFPGQRVVPLMTVGLVAGLVLVVGSLRG